MASLNILIVEDDPVWLKCISDYLERETDMKGSHRASSREEAIQICREVYPDVVLMDIHLSDGKFDGIDAVLEIKTIIETKIIMLTSFTDKEMIINSFAAGAVSYVAKSDYKQLPSVIRAAMCEITPIQTLMSDYLRLRKEEQLTVLTTAEKEVFGLIEQGFTQSQIEKKLYKSSSTIKNQVNRILKKFNVRSSKEAIEKVKSRRFFE
ncbi:DNA-binding response regulator [Paenibacillus marchantiophytorum]|uniref:DNA-binding response regulator n=1 Tax=Paenibacillus marchantiophytorum TaxID=1619310 RepID=A0ABQ1F9I1_9BACL|nr:response regulator transcription factor [Paenibacillus marchantiophytorum]GGA03554.1 DNA-binding response regulator [Paenibacillus marchantiophytorum]